MHYLCDILALFMFISTFIFLLTLVLHNSVYVLVEITKGKSRKNNAATNSQIKDNISRRFNTYYLSFNSSGCIINAMP